MERDERSYDEGFAEGWVRGVAACGVVILIVAIIYGLTSCTSTSKVSHHRLCPGTEHKH